MGDKISAKRVKDFQDEIVELEEKFKILLQNFYLQRKSKASLKIVEVKFTLEVMINIQESQLV